MLWPLQQALPSFEQQEAFAWESQVAHCFFEAQEARKSAEAAVRMVAKRIIGELVVSSQITASRSDRITCRDEQEGEEEGEPSAGRR